MQVASRRSAPVAVLAASTVLVVKAGLGLWAAYALMSATPAHHRTFLGGVVRSRQTGLGWVLFVLAIASIVVGIALTRVVPWARVSAFALEGAGIVLAAARVASRPASSVLSLMLSAAVILSLLSPSAAAAFPGRRASSAGTVS
jgi:hypothetical protein